MTPSCSALAQNGSNFRSDSSCPSTLPPMGAPRMPSFLTPISSCSAARSGCCRAHCRHAHEPIGVPLDPLGGFLVLQIADPASKVAIGRVPPRVHVERRDVDALFVHVLEPAWSEVTILVGGLSLELHLERRASDKINRFRDEMVGVNVDDGDAAAADHRSTASCGRGLSGVERHTREAATCDKRTRRCARHVLQKRSSIPHRLLLRIAGSATR